MKMTAEMTKNRDIEVIAASVVVLILCEITMVTKKNNVKDVQGHKS